MGTIQNENEQKKSLKKEVYKISILYALIGGLWILLSDSIFVHLFTDIKKYKYYQSYKGCFFILITTHMVYALVKRRMNMWLLEYNRREKVCQELKQAHEELISLETELDFQKKLNDNIYMEAPSIIITWNDKGRIISINPFGQKLIGYTEEELVNSPGWPVLIPKDRVHLADETYNKIRNNKNALNFEGAIITKDGRMIDILWSSKVLSQTETGDNIYVSIGTDIEERKKYEEKIKYMAYYDPLTGLPNRIMFEQEVSNQIENGNQNFALAYMDIDNFKNINDSLGHHAGDIFLKYFTEKVVQKVKDKGFVARLGGDEFAVFLPGNSVSSIKDNVEELLNYINRIWTYQNRQFYISVSVGIVMYPEHGKSLSELLKNADIAMYTSKKEGKNRFLFYEEGLMKKQTEFAEMVNNLQQGIDEEQFFLVYQPQYRLWDREIIGLEALIRWEHPKEGFIAPGEFIPVAERTGQIYRLDRWVLRKVLEQKMRLENLGFADIELAINLSSKTLTSEINFNEWVQILSEYPVDLSKIVIEITETADILYIEKVIERLKILKEKGIRIALDDFGTGYSSLNYLKKFPIDIIKLDRSFINAITDNRVDNILIKNILKLAADLQYEVIAEGIETPEQIQCLINYNCGYGQGYLLSRPHPIDKIYSLLAKGTESVSAII